MGRGSQHPPGWGASRHDYMLLTSKSLALLEGILLGGILGALRVLAVNACAFGKPANASDWPWRPPRRVFPAENRRPALPHQGDLDFSFARC